MAIANARDAKDYGTIVRNNLMKVEGYAPYCGGEYKICGLPRMTWDGEQFKCRCGYRTNFDDAFVQAYRERWGLVDPKSIAKKPLATEP